MVAMRAWPLFLFAAPMVLRCSSTNTTTTPQALNPYVAGEQACDPASNAQRRITFDPPFVVVGPGQTRPVRMVVDPDVCTPQTVVLTSDAGDVAQPPAAAKLDFRHASYDFIVTGGAPGKTRLTASMNNTFDGSTVTGALPVDVRDASPGTCAVADANQGMLDATHPSVSGSGSIASASVGAAQAAFVRTDTLGLPAFEASIACASADLAAESGLGLSPLGPAVKFDANAPVSGNEALRREIDFAIPINPAAIPAAGRMRHLVVLFKSPLAQKARPITIANPRVDAAGSGYVLKFQSPWFGTYQAAMASDAGTVKRTRHLTHRAVIGFSMGGGGSATFGVRHHDMFDAIAPMGGPSDWTWMLSFVENYALGGFCAFGKTCAKTAPDRYVMRGETYAHSEDFNHWWYEKGNGNGGSFGRDEYTQIFEDLALMRGNPNGQNAALPSFASGPMPSDPWVNGKLDTDGKLCSVTVDPISKEPNEVAQKQIQDKCNKARCDPANAFKVPTGYYDDEYNPTGSEQVISFCDGARVGESASPYEDTWVSPGVGGGMPMSLALAVDLNKNGMRDEDEPVIRSGHEPFDDVGTDGKADIDEPGYDPLKNPDPNQDNYNFQLNPTGTEGDHRYDLGEPFKDVGLDGVANTKTSPYDFGEGDGQYTQTSGRAAFEQSDPHALIRGWSTDTPGGPLDDNAIARLDAWTDGGVRDLFNFAAVANHFTGAYASRKWPNGRQIHSTAFYNNFEWLPGQEGPDGVSRVGPNDYVASNVRWADVASVPSLRYGTVDATPAQIEAGDGQHVGTAAQLLYRLETAFYYAAQRWPDADRLLSEKAILNPATTTKNELGLECEANGRCEKIFTGPKTGRTGPVAITLPPGYANEDSRKRDVRYPVVFVLHGYGQDPRDLEAVALISNNFMNDGNHSYVTRLPKFITVYVDGRCRIGKNGLPECIRGTFYLNSTRQDGPQLDAWFDEVVQYIDQNYRTMGPSDVEVIE